MVDTSERQQQAKKYNRDSASKFCRCAMDSCEMGWPLGGTRVNPVVLCQGLGNEAPNSTYIVFEEITVLP